MELDKTFIFAQAPTHDIKDSVQLVLVLANGDLRPVESFSLADQEREKQLKETIVKYEELAPGAMGPHGRFDDYKFFWTDAHGFKTEMKLSLKPKEELDNGEDIPNQS